MLIIAHTSSIGLFPDNVPKLILEDTALLSEVLIELEEFIRDLAKDMDRSKDIKSLAQSLGINYNQVNADLQISFADKNQQQLFVQRLMDNKFIQLAVIDKNKIHGIFMDPFKIKPRGY